MYHLLPVTEVQFWEGPVTADGSLLPLPVTSSPRRQPRLCSLRRRARRVSPPSGGLSCGSLFTAVCCGRAGGAACPASSGAQGEQLGPLLAAPAALPPPARAFEVQPRSRLTGSPFPLRSGLLCEAACASVLFAGRWGVPLAGRQEHSCWGRFCPSRVSLLSCQYLGGPRPCVPVCQTGARRAWESGSAVAVQRGRSGDEGPCPRLWRSRPWSLASPVPCCAPPRGLAGSGCRLANVCSVVLAVLLVVWFCDWSLSSLLWMHVLHVSQSTSCQCFHGAYGLTFEFLNCKKYCCNIIPIP